MSQWIEFNKQRPEEKKRVLIFTVLQRTEIAELNHNSWWNDTDEPEIPIELVTHWMPLPGNPQ